MSWYPQIPLPDLDAEYRRYRVVEPHPLRFGATMLPPLTLQPPLIRGPGWARGFSYGELVERLADAVGEVEA